MATARFTVVYHKSMRFSKCVCCYPLEKHLETSQSFYPIDFVFSFGWQARMKECKIYVKLMLSLVFIFFRCFPALLLEHRNHFGPLISFSSLVLFDHHGIETHSSHQERWENRDEGSSSSDDELVKSSMMIDGKGRPRGRVIGSQWHVVQLLLQRFHRRLTRSLWAPDWLIQN